jgi:hypothetical protein
MEYPHLKTSNTMSSQYHCVVLEIYTVIVLNVFENLISVVYFSRCIKSAKHSHYRPGQGPEGSKRLRLPDFKTIGTLW